MKKNKNTISIKDTVMLALVISTVFSLVALGSLIFFRWLDSSRKTAETVLENLTDDINQEIMSYMDTPRHIIDLNKKIVEDDIFDMSEKEKREKYFVGILSSHIDSIYSFSFGSTQGEYYGARRNEDGSIEIMMNDATTGGESWYYSITQNNTSGELAVKAGKFDPRTRAWYKAAVESKQLTFSPVYKHFVMDDLAVSAAAPIYDIAGELEGVLGVHMLLDDIGGFLADSIDEYDGNAIIIEKETGSLIANSMGAANFSVREDGALVRFTPDEILTTDLKEFYEEYDIADGQGTYFEGEKENLFINTREVNMNGLDWIVLVSVPEKYFIGQVVESIHYTILLSVAALLLILGLYHLTTKKLMKPIDDLLDVSDAISGGDFSRRVPVKRDDEIGIISKALNKTVDTLQFHINNLERSVEERTKELNESKLASEANTEKLNLILNSTAEGIFGIDINNCFTFCNARCLKLLGYDDEKELIGKNMHQLIHHTNKEKSIPVDECRIMNAMLLGKAINSSDEVFWRKDGSSFHVEYDSYPQIKDGKLIGGVVTFTDITDRKKREQEIEYLNSHDTLTGLCNRKCFEQNFSTIDKEDNLPLSIIFADINGLKMTNDIFGHLAGDRLIRKSAEIIEGSCRKSDLIARVGGDEFVIVLPKTEKEETLKVIEKIRKGFEDAHVEAIKCSISLGSDTKHNTYQSIEVVMANAENAMYKDKTMNRKSNNDGIISRIISTLHLRSDREREHSENVARLCRDLAKKLGLNETEIDKTVRAGYLHDIGKITLEKEILEKDELGNEDMEKMRQHSVVGYRILNLFDDTLDLAEYIYGHHERWDGKGYPRGLSEEKIPVISRIISVTETYERVLNKGDGTYEEKRKNAARVIEEGIGNQFDPKIARTFLELLKSK